MSFTCLVVEIRPRFGCLSIPWISLIVLVCSGFQGACEIGRGIPSLKSCRSCDGLFGLRVVFAGLWKWCLERHVVGSWGGRSTLGLIVILARPVDFAAAAVPAASIFCLAWCRWTIWNTLNSDVRAYWSTCYFWSCWLTNDQQLLQETSFLLKYAAWMTYWIWPINTCCFAAAPFGVILPHSYLFSYWHHYN